MADSDAVEPEKKSNRFAIFIYAVVGIFLLTLFFGILMARKNRKQAEDARFLRDIMVVQEALLQYIELTDGGADASVPVRSKRLRETVAECSIGGRWRLTRKERSGSLVVTEFVVENPSRTVQEMEVFDLDVDDGNLSTGKFAIKGHGIYAIEILANMERPDGAMGDLEEPDKRAEELANRVLNRQELDGNYVKR
jgi:hypothetical protein